MTRRPRSFRHLRTFAALLYGIAFACSATTKLRAVTVETLDDKSSTGTITGVENGQLLIQPKASDPAITRIPLSDIIAINLSWQDRQAHIASPAPTPSPAVSSTQPTSSPAPALPSATTQTGSTTRPKSPVIKPKTTKWRVELGSADHVIATLGDWSDTRLALGLDSDIAITVPIEQVHAIWSSVAFQVKKAKDLKLAPQAQDIAFVEKEGEVKPVTGLAVGLESTADGDFLKFKFEGEERKIKLDRLVGVMLAQRDTTAEKSLYATFNLVNGDVLSGKVQGLANSSFQIVPLAGGDQAAPVDISLGNITKIEMHNGRLAWLTEFSPSSVSQAPYFDRLMPYQVNQSLTGGPIVMAEGTVAKGIAVHSRCVLTYDIDSAYERFRGKIGFQQPDGKLGRAAVRIVGDGKVLWQDEDLKGDAKSTPVDVVVSGVKQLTLEVDYGKNQDVGDRVVWGEPRLIKAAAN